MRLRARRCWPVLNELRLHYNVSGFSPIGLDKLAAPVDQVLSEQMRRLKSFAERGKPE